MRKVILGIVLSALFTSPALANEWRLEARGGVVWSQGVEEGFAGLAVGYDFDLGDAAFVGVETGIDKILVSDGLTWNNVARLGFNAGKAKLYGLGGYSVTEGENAWTGGAGVQFKIGSQAYIKAEYRRFFVDSFADVNAVGVGVGGAF